jgi:hypothetical protein
MNVEIHADCQAGVWEAVAALNRKLDPLELLIGFATFCRARTATVRSGPAHSRAVSTASSTTCVRKSHVHATVRELQYWQYEASTQLRCGRQVGLHLRRASHSR